MMLTRLIPFAYYELRVTAGNGVSSQDNNINARTVTISIMTEGGGSYYSWNTLYVCTRVCMCVCVHTHTAIHNVVCILCVCVCAHMHMRATKYTLVVQSLIKVIVLLE